MSLGLFSLWIFEDERVRMMWYLQPYFPRCHTFHTSKLCVSILRVIIQFGLSALFFSSVNRKEVREFLKDVWLISNFCSSPANVLDTMLLRNSGKVEEHRETGSDASALPQRFLWCYCYHRCPEDSTNNTCRY